MELWQRTASTPRGWRSPMPALPAKPDLLDGTDMIVAAGGGERDIPADSAILTGMRKAAAPGPFLNERLMSDFAPDFVPGATAQPPRRQYLQSFTASSDRRAHS